MKGGIILWLSLILVVRIIFQYPGKEPIKFESNVFEWPFFQTESSQGTTVVTEFGDHTIQLQFDGITHYNYGDQIFFNYHSYDQEKHWKRQESKQGEKQWAKQWGNSNESYGGIFGGLKAEQALWYPYNSNLNCTSIKHPGFFDVCRWLSIQGIDYQIKVISHSLIQESSKPKIVQYLAKIPNKIFDRFIALFPKNYSTIYAMIFGSRFNYLDSQLKQQFLDIGLVHMLVVSGSQVTFLVAVIFFFCKIIHLRFRIYVIILVQLLYLVMVGLDPSILRAMLMADIFIINHYVLVRRYPPWWYLTISAILVLIIDPNYVLLAGFWYSFLISWALIMIVPIILTRFIGPKWLIGYIISNCIAVTVAIPIQLLQQSYINLYSYVANLWLSWFAIVILFVGLLCLLISVLSISVAKIIAKTLDFSVDVMIQVMNDLALGSDFIRFNRYAVFTICCIYFLMIVWFIYRRYLRVIILTSITLIILTVYLTFQRSLLIALDVGQGDATLVLNGYNVMLIDVGGSYPSFRSRILPILNYYGVNSIDSLVITHHDHDHIGGLPELLRLVDVQQIISPEYIHHPNHHLISFQTQLSIGDGACIISSPTLFSVSHQSNNQSLIVHCNVNNTSFLITGDNNQMIELAAIRAGVIQPVDLLKLGHHGSKYSNSAELFISTQPTFIWNSSGRNNPFGHPHRSVIKRLQEFGIPYRSTHRDGIITIAL